MTEKIWLCNYSEGQPMFESRFALLIGRPKSTKDFTVEQLESIGLIGVYHNSDDTTKKDTLK